MCDKMGPLMFAKKHNVLHILGNDYFELPIKRKHGLISQKPFLRFFQIAKNLRINDPNQGTILQFPHFSNKYIYFSNKYIYIKLKQQLRLMV